MDFDFEFELDLCVTPSQDEDVDEDVLALSCLSSISDLTTNTNDTYSIEEEKEICLYVYAEHLKMERQIRIFTNKMRARRRLGFANIIKRAICQKGLWRRSTTALKLWKLTLIHDKLKRTKSLYY